MQEVAARPIFSHPTQNFSVVQFDPSLVRGSFTAAVLSSRETEYEDDDGDGGSGGGVGKTGDTGGGVDSNNTESVIKNDGGGGGDDDCGGGGVVHSDASTATAAGTAAASVTTASVTTAIDTDSDTETNTVGSNGNYTRKEGGEEEEKEEEERAPLVDAAIPASSPSPPPPRETPQLANRDSCHRGNTPAFPVAAAARKNIVGKDARLGEKNSDRDSPPPLRPGDMAEFYGLTAANAPVRQRAAVVKLERISLATSAHPQYTAHSVEVSSKALEFNIPWWHTHSSEVCSALQCCATFVHSESVP